MQASERGPGAAVARQQLAAAPRRAAPAARCAASAFLTGTNICAMWASTNTTMPLSGRGPLRTAAAQVRMYGHRVWLVDACLEAGLVA